EIEMPGLEGLQRHGVVAVVVECQVVEIVETAVHRQVLAPIVLDACIANCAPGLDALHAVGAAAQRWLQASRGEVAFGPPVGGQHGELAENQWQFAVTGMLEVEAYPARAFGDD